MATISPDKVRNILGNKLDSFMHQRKRRNSAISMTKIENMHDYFKKENEIEHRKKSVGCESMENDLQNLI